MLPEHSLPTGLPDLTLSFAAPSDAPELYDLTVRNKAHLEPWLPWIPFIKALADTENFIARAIADGAENKSFVCLMRYQGRLCGACGFNAFHHANDSAEIGYWLGAEFTKKGIVRHAVQALIDYGFSVRKLHKVIIFCATLNEASRKVPQALGFHLDGIIRAHERFKDEWRDSEQYSLLHSEWVSTPSEGRAEGQELRAD
eukprot:GEMP01054006.1.p1 GENE.GEMP01054006.1~~GEMP01054006.1.p1  ORF type:complete len:200 (+),score=48.08 GEMP01054006.1:66-665(+)